MDKYATDADFWRRDAENTYDAAILLFRGDNLGHWLPAAILGHHAVEMLLKAALILQGDAVTNRGPKDSTVWGHDLTILAERLASKRDEFRSVFQAAPSIQAKLARFNAFFNELRYPLALREVGHLGPGEDEAEILAELMAFIRPFADPSHS